ncbi:MAG: hypothetical protein ACKN9W_18470 [Methylococcus sp.]
MINDTLTSEFINGMKSRAIARFRLAASGRSYPDPQDFAQESCS